MAIESCSCPKCGSQNPPDSRMCRDCGTIFANDKPVETPIGGDTGRTPSPVFTPAQKSGPSWNFFLIFLTSTLSGMVIGWIRYWIGFFIVFQGAAAAGLIIWGFQTFRNPPPQGAAVTNSQAWTWALGFMLVFWAGQLCGLGLAQPWFDPLDYFSTIFSGNGLETVFGTTQTRTFTGGFSGFMWVFCSALDSIIMLVILAIGIRD